MTTHGQASGEPSGVSGKGYTMAVIAGDQTAPRNFLNYALRVTRKDLMTGQRLGVQHLKLMSPFKQAPIDPGQGFGRVIQGAADGSEGTLASI